MLGKKSLAIALMGLGLAGSCFAGDPNGSKVVVEFTAKVVTATCPFSVTGTADSKVDFGDVPLAGETDPQKMVFSLNCSTKGCYL